MAENPPWHEDLNSKSEKELDEESGVDADAEANEDMTHAQLDALAEAKHIELPAGLNKGEKAAYINDNAV